MIYITGIHALNLPCMLDTCGDWHCSALKWQDISFRNTDNMHFGLYGIEKNKHIPEHKETFFVANHIRALLDLIEEGNFTVAQGMKEDFICNDTYTNEIFNKVYELKFQSNWENIKAFMGKEYMLQWFKWLKTKGD